jgi:plasmid stabilization system protein ParE
MKYRITILPPAQENVLGIVRWLRKQSPQGARAWRERWLEVIAFLKESAHSCAEAPESVDHSLKIQQAIFRTRHGNPYHAVFTIRGNMVFVFQVRGPGQSEVSMDELELPPEN